MQRKQPLLVTLDTTQPDLSAGRLRAVAGGLTVRVQPAVKEVPPDPPSIDGGSVVSKGDDSAGEAPRLTILDA